MRNLRKFLRNSKNGFIVAIKILVERFLRIRKKSFGNWLRISTGFESFWKYGKSFCDIFFWNFWLEYFLEFLSIFLHHFSDFLWFFNFSEFFMTQKWKIWGKILIKNFSEIDSKVLQVWDIDEEMEHVSVAVIFYGFFGISLFTLIFQYYYE